MATIHIDEQNADRDIEIPLGTVLEVRLAETATTGYRWSVANDDQRLVPLPVAASPPPSKPPGAAASRRWQFKAIQRGPAKITFSLARSWESNAPLKSVTFSMKVT
jgi:inhibitor of cysteine peptidase